jgi:CHAT domain-containing protein
MNGSVPNRQRVAKDVLAVANPALQQQTRAQMASYYRGLEFGPLPDAEREAGAVCALYGPRACVMLGREEATETRLRSAIGSARIIHLAMHGVFDDREPMYSRLLLAHGDGALDDGLLEAREIAALNLHADLVVLSACDTARGMIGGGEGVVGMTWAFFAAGARSLVATQWKVASKPTADLMIAFHRALRARGDGASLKKMRALREAQLQLLRQPATRHPFYWAGFVLLGDAS